MISKNIKEKDYLSPLDEAESNNPRAVLDPNDFSEETHSQAFANNLALIINVYCQILYII